MTAHLQADFEGLTILVTGASLGIGRAVARAFHDAGANLVIVARRREPLVQAAKDLEPVLVHAADVADLAAMRTVVDRAVARFGALHGLVNNAGVHFRGPFARRTPDEIASMVDVNLRAPLALTSLVLPHLREHGGFVVNVASLAGKLPLDGAATYSATKFGLRVFTMALARELRGSGVTISAVCPGPVDTGFIMSEIDQVENVVFAQRMCTAEDVARMVLACARDGRIERAYPAGASRMATLGYVLPGLRDRLRPLLDRKGRRVKERLRRSRRG